MPSRQPFITATTLKYHESPGTVVSELQTKAARDIGLRALGARIAADGFRPVSGKQAAWGFAASWTASDNKKQEVDVRVQSFSKPGSRDAACLLQVVVKASGPLGRGSRAESVTYNAYLVAPNGNFDKAIEHFATSTGTVRRANSFWTRFKKCAKASCGSTCAAALVTCIPGSVTWVAYFVCFGIACGGCFAKCFACAGCKCRWWCKWGVGCCRD